MKIGIVYASRDGKTKECAALLAKELKNHECTVLEIGKDNIDLDEFDIVVIGFSIRMAKPIPAARSFLKKNREKLLSCRVGYFICCGFVDCFEEYARKSLPRELYDGALAISCFGGSLDPSRFKGFDRFLVKTIRNEILGGGDNADQRSDMTLPTILETNIIQFTERIREKI